MASLVTKLNETQEQKLSLKGLEVHSVKADGHCLLHAIREVMHCDHNISITLDELKTMLKVEVLNHFDEYKQFLADGEVQIFDVDGKIVDSESDPNQARDKFSKELNSYLNTRVYCSDATDYVIPALCNALSLTLVIYVSYCDERGCHLIEERHPPSRVGNNNRIVHLIRSGARDAEHYDGLVHMKAFPAQKRTAENRGNKSAPASVATKRKSIGPLKITDLFSKKSFVSVSMSNPSEFAQILSGDFGVGTSTSSSAATQSSTASTQSTSAPTQSSSGPTQSSTATTQSSTSPTQSTSPPTQSSSALPSDWPNVWNETQWRDKRQQYTWLDSRQGKLGCTACIAAKSLGPFKEKGVSLSDEWCKYRVESSVIENRSTQLASLRVKIKKHLDSKAHIVAVKIQKDMDSEVLRKSFAVVDSAVDRETEAVFRTAYYLAKNNRPFSDHEQLIQLQKQNGLDLGLILHSRFSSTAIINHIASEMRRKVVQHLVDNSSKLSVVIDESTTLGKEAVMVVHVKAAMGGGEPIFMFLDLVELKGQTSDIIVAALCDCLKAAGFSDDYLQENFIAFVSDGASVMLGRLSGVATQLCSKYPNLFTWHCLNHRLELAVSDAVRDVGNVFHFKAFLDSIYCLYSQSSKNNRELKLASTELESQILKIGRVLDMRWVASSFRTVRAVWVSFAPLALHFKTASEDVSRDGVERKKYGGLLTRLASAEFICDLGLMYDVLLELSNLSQELQSRSMTIPRSAVLISRSIRVLQTFKETPGEKLEEALHAKESLELHGVTLKSNVKMRSLNRGQFIQSLVDNMNSRLCDGGNADSFMKDLDVFDRSKWPENPSIRHGEKEIRSICKRFRLNSDQALRGMREYIDNTDSDEEPLALHPILTCIRSIPCSSSECERGFSLMNTIDTELRTTLLVTNISSLMFVNINGSPLELFVSAPFIQSWKLKHRLATDARSRKCLPKPVDNTRRRLWDVLNM